MADDLEGVGSLAGADSLGGDEAGECQREDQGGEKVV